MQQCGPELVRCLALGCNPTWGASRAASAAGAMAGPRCPAGMEERIRADTSVEKSEARAERSRRELHDSPGAVSPGFARRFGLNLPMRCPVCCAGGRRTGLPVGEREPPNREAGTRHSRSFDIPAHWVETNGERRMCRVALCGAWKHCLRSPRLRDTNFVVVPFGIV